MSPNLKTETWEGSLLEWIEVAALDYFSPSALLDYQRWLTEQLSLPGNVIPFRLISGRAPKGSEFVRTDGTTFYAADNEPLAGLWKIVSDRNGAPTESLRELLSNRRIPGSWPPRNLPTRFTCKWGPAPLTLKDRGLKIAHLLDSGRNPIPIEPDQLSRRALLTLSLLNCFPMPNSGVTEFTRAGRPSGDLAERIDVQALLLSFVAEHVGGAAHLDSLFSAFGTPNDLELELAWRKRAADFRFAVAPKAAGQRSENGRQVSGNPGRQFSGTDRQVSKTDGPRSFGKHRRVYGSFDELIPVLRPWLSENPGVQRLDDRTAGPNGASYVRFEVEHLAKDDFTIQRPCFPGSSWSASDYTGVFHFNGDTKADALRQMIEMVDDGLDVDEILEPAITMSRRINGNQTGEKPCFVLDGSGGAKGLYCYSDRA